MFVIIKKNFLLNEYLKSFLFILITLKICIMFSKILFLLILSMTNFLKQWNRLRLRNQLIFKFKNAYILNYSNFIHLLFKIVFLYYLFYNFKSLTIFVLFFF